MAGYSGTPLAKKLGIAAGMRVAVIDAPDGFRASLAPLPADVTFVAAVDARCQLVHLFTASRAVLAKALERYRKTLASDAVVWVSWPKKAAKVATDVTEDVIREVALPIGFVDVKVCAVDETWSGLKLVVRKTLR
jgi:hypothetical protein